MAPGNYSVTFTNTTFGCTNTINNFTIGAGPQLVVDQTTTATTCLGAADGAINLTPQTAGTFTYTLTPGNTVATDAGFTGLAAGSYSVAFVNQLGCAGNIPNIAVAAGPALQMGQQADNASCTGVNNGTITMEPATAGTYQYTLTPGGLNSSNPVFSNIAAGTYSVSYMNQLGCAGQVDNIVVGTDNAIRATVSPVNPNCYGINDGTVTVTGNSGSTPYTVTLEQTGASLTGNAVTFTNLAPNAAMYFVSQDAIGCITRDTVTLSTNPEIKLTQTDKRMPDCFGGNNGYIYVEASGGASGFTYSSNNGVSFQNTGKFDNLVANTYQIIVKDNLGCTKDTVIVLDQPTSALTATASNTRIATCDGNDGQVTITAAGGTPPYTYSLDGVNFSDSSAILTTPSTGDWNSLTVKDANGCTATASATVTYTNNLVVDLGADSLICEDARVLIEPQITGNVTGFNWSPNSFISSTTTRDVTVDPRDTTTYTLVVTQGPCTATDSKTINVLWKPHPNAGLDTVVCLNKPAMLLGSVTHTSGPVTYHWSDTTGLSHPDSIWTGFTPSVDSAFNFIKTLTVKDDYGCDFEITDQAVISVQPPVPASAGRDTIAVRGTPHILLGTGGTQYVWSPADKLDNPFSPNPRATIYDDTRFYVQVTTEYGCVGHDTIMVKVYQGPTYYVPNAFSPNGDGLNDVFRPIPVGISYTEFFRVFNRWGEMVYSGNQWLKGWDGTFKGKLAPLGVYTWVVKGVDQNGKKVEMKGTVMLVQ